MHSIGPIDKQEIPKGNPETFMKEQKSSVNDLPIELKTIIYAILPIREQGNPRLVSKQWRAESLEFVKEQQQALIKSMTKIVSVNLDPSKYSRVIAAFQEMQNKNTIAAKSDLLQVKKSLLNMRSLISFTLKELSGVELHELDAAFKSCEIPQFFNKTLFLAQVRKRMQTGENYVDLAKLLISQGLSDEVLKLDLIGRLQEESPKNLILRLLAVDHVKQGKLEQALSIMNISVDKPVEILVVSDFMNALFCAGLGAAVLKLGLIERVQDPMDKIDILASLALHLIQEEKIDEALSIMDKAPSSTISQVNFKKFSLIYLFAN